MNNPSPFSPENSATEQKNQSRTRVRTAVTLVFAANFIALMALLIIGFGCRKPAEPEVPAPDTNVMAMPAFDTNTVALSGTNALATNTTVYVPPAPEPPTPTASRASEYTIVKGDYFEKIAKDHGVTTKAIQDANPGVDSKKLKIGQKIQIPAAASAVAAPAGTPAVADTTGAEQIYKVKSGDTLTVIAKHLNVSVKTIEKANPQIDPNKLKVGDKLKVPAKASAPVAAPVVPEATAPAQAPAPSATSPKAL